MVILTKAFLATSEQNNKIFKSYIRIHDFRLIAIMNATNRIETSYLCVIVISTLHTFCTDSEQSNVFIYYMKQATISIQYMYMKL